MAAEGKPGRDYIFNVTVKNPAGAAQDLNAVDGCALIASVEGRTIAQWSKNTVDGYTPMIIMNAALGLVKIHLPAANTADIDNVEIKIEPVVQITDPDFGVLELPGITSTLIKITSTPKNKIPDLS